MIGLAEWLMAQFDADERSARAATPGPWRAVETYDDVFFVEAAAGNIANESSDGHITPADAKHIARCNPAAVLAEIDAKRKLVAAIQGDPFDAMGAEWAYEDLVLRYLAAPYSGRDGYDAAWGFPERDRDDVQIVDGPAAGHRFGWKDGEPPTLLRVGELNALYRRRENTDGSQPRWLYDHVPDEAATPSTTCAER